MCRGKNRNLESLSNDDVANLTYICSHGLFAYRKNHPGASPADILKGMVKGERLTSAMAQTMAGRPLRETQSLYILSPDRMGIFVVQPNERKNQAQQKRPLVLITFLRFSLQQEDFAVKHWGEGTLPETESISVPPPPPSPVSAPKADWFEGSRLSLRKVRIEEKVRVAFGGKNAAVRAIKSSLSLSSEVDMDLWKVTRRLQDPKSKICFTIQYKIGIREQAHAFFEGDESG